MIEIAGGIILAFIALAFLPEVLQTIAIIVGGIAMIFGVLFVLELVMLSLGAAQ